jgi:PilZ domain-containing protein
LRVETQRGGRWTSESPDARRRPRFKLEVDMQVYPRDCPVVQGHSVDISESGISAMLREEVSVGAVVRLEFTLALGKVDVLAVVRHRNAFRYGFQFVEISSGQDVVGRTCRQLSVESALWECPSSTVPPPG